MCFLVLPGLVMAEDKLLLQSDLEYIGAFKVPKGNLGGASLGTTLNNGGSGLAYNATNNTLIMSGPKSERLLTEINIPTPIISGNLGDLNTAITIQSPVDIANSNWDNLKIDKTAIANGGRVGGFLFYNQKLIGSAYAYYDANYEAALSHFIASPNWISSGTQFEGMYRVGNSPIGGVNGGFVGGYMANIPAAWQADFGGPALTGQAALSIITRTSYGPSVSVFDPDAIGILDPVPAKMIVGYPSTHQTLGTYGGTSLNFNMGTAVNGVVFPERSRSVLFFGRHGLGYTGLGDGCYGFGTSIYEEQGRTASSVPNTCDGVTITGENLCCYDPSNSEKGNHAYPYVYRIWAYDASDLAKVANATINSTTGQQYEPWEIMPYAIWNIDLSFSPSSGIRDIKGIAYDNQSQRIYITQGSADVIGFDNYPVIHVFKVVAANDISAPFAPSGLSVI